MKNWSAPKNTKLQNNIIMNGLEYTSSELLMNTKLKSKLSLFESLMLINAIDIISM